MWSVGGRGVEKSGPALIALPMPNEEFALGINVTDTVNGLK